MKKIHIFTAIIALISSISLVAPVAVFAQYTTYVPTYGTQYNYGTSYVPTYNTYGNTYSPSYGGVGGGVCVNLTSGLYKGLSDKTTGGQVSILQSFLISQGYLVLSAPSGYFGALTYQAVGRYQSAHELPYNGTADVATRASIQAVSCGNNYGYNNNYNNYYGAPVLSSLSASSGAVGMSITIYGSGFDLSNNTVNFGGVTLVGIPSYAGTALAFVVPQVNNQNYSYNNYNYNNYNYNNYNYDNNYNYNYNNGYNTSGSYSVSVMNSRGTSNSLQFTVTGNNYCNNYNNGYNNSYNNCYNNYNNQGQPYLSSISPNSARVGTQVTLYGSGFSSYGNTVHFGNGGAMNLSALSNGTMLYYTIPYTVSACDITSGYGVACPMYAQQITPGTYPIYVSNSYGQSSTMYFTVTY
jgi:hypothetical protein